MTAPPNDARKPIVRLFEYAGPWRRNMLLATLCSIANKLFDVAPEILIGIAIDVVVRGQDSFVASMGITDPQQQIFLLGGLTLAVWIGESAFEYLYLILWRNLAQQLQHSLRMDTYDHVQALDLRFFEDQSTGGLVSVLNDDVNQLERFLDGGANNLIQVATAVVAVGAVFFAISTKIALLAFLPIPVILWGAFFFQKRAQPRYADVRTRVGELASRLQNNLAGIATIKSFTTESLESQRLRDQSDAYVKANRAAIAISSAFIPVIRMAILTGFVLTFVVGGIMTLDGTLEVGAYGVLVFLTQRLLWPLTGLAETVDLYERAMASTRRILDLLNTPIVLRDRPDAVELEEVHGQIAIRDVSFAYDDGRPVLEGIHLTMDAGTTTAIVGATGSGKSTLAKLLLRFYQPGTGTICVDNRDISQITGQSLRRHIGLVSQDIYLFHGSVRENIAYGRPNASDAEITDAARAAEALEFIDRLPSGLDTIIGERGQKLSGGQRQRLAIARAVLKDPPILVLDEATSAVDNETEAAIQRSMRHIAQGRTTVVIAHRLSTIVDADQIIVLESGRIIERGNHEQLLSLHGTYADLWQVQTGGYA